MCTILLSNFISVLIDNQELSLDDIIENLKDNSSFPKVSNEEVKEIVRGLSLRELLVENRNGQYFESMIAKNQVMNVCLLL